MRRAALIPVGLVALVALVVESVPVLVYLWDGGYELTAHVEATEPPPASVVLYPVGDRDAAEWLCGRSPGPADFEPGGKAVTAAPPAGVTPVRVRIQTSGRRTVFGREVGWSQPRFLVAAAEWPGGRRSCQVVEIPDGRESREVRVQVR